MGEDVQSPNPFIGRRLGPPDNAWVWQIPLLRSRLFELKPRHVPRRWDAASVPIAYWGTTVLGPPYLYQYSWVFSRLSFRVLMRQRDGARTVLLSVTDVK